MTTLVRRHTVRGRDRFMAQVAPPRFLRFGICFLGIAILLVNEKRGFLDTSSAKENIHLYTDPDEVPDIVVQNLDAIFVLGGGRPKSMSEPPVFTQKRCDAAAKIRLRSSMSLPILCLSAGTAHVPQLLSESGLPVWESTSSAAYLALQHNLTDDIFVETTSYDTIGNAFFSRASFADIVGWRRLLIVTSKFHMERSMAIFDWIFGIKTTSAQYELFYLQSGNEGLSEEAVEARAEKEATSLKSALALSKKYVEMKQVWSFLNTQHDLYTASGLVLRSNNQYGQASSLIQKSYGG